MKKLFWFSPVVYLFFASLQSCQDYSAVPVGNPISIVNTNLVESAFMGAYNGVIQIRHDQGSIDSLGTPQEVYFMRYGGDANSSFHPPMTLELNKEWEIAIDESYNTLREQSEIFGLFGKEMILKLNKKSRGVDKSSNDIEVGYVPEVLKSNINTIPLQLFHNETVISWNSDARNSNGVYLIADFNQAFNGSGNAGCTDYVVLPDNGTYTYDRNDFPCLPSGVLVSFTLVRGLSAELIDDESEGKDIVLAYTTNGQLLYSAE
ncbi:hypothetical protein FUA23_20460 [Neolewinella aurantiaca]|uniref:Uncharacterized protein n=1 Tax=Neolewinella aurantiaca TaxID=2602767 RepID=A0A5C7F505_9BACT|nr:hypothetical protein [Neolewinella aurantiaca]TXF85672.1 hypothetical protein FUA23_20460 [Neolewinella aurantiaca]